VTRPWHLDLVIVRSCGVPPFQLGVDRAYTNLENKIASWTVERDALAAEIKSMLEDAEFNGQSINVREAQRIIHKGVNSWTVPTIAQTIWTSAPATKRVTLSDTQGRFIVTQTAVELPCMLGRGREGVHVRVSCA
jgi:hypothetical protein